ncbi:hypothetical protein CBM2587_A150081 [Cupriavidus taiwanensis]|uniref:Uncharacterized protein n=1 Tax=Cupriavidus taiwanensis TaxID=164546 RepID=A0A375BI45_9BURK|nr:hypothetical protein CBM2587_A150081 [Cupriavidus taiwanensis]
MWQTICSAYENLERGPAGKVSAACSTGRCRQVRRRVHTAWHSCGRCPRRAKPCCRRTRGGCWRSCSSTTGPSWRPGKLSVEGPGRCQARWRRPRAARRAQRPMPVPGAPPDGPVVPRPPVPVLGASGPLPRVVLEPVTEGEPVEPEGAATPDAPAARPAPASVPWRVPEARELPGLSPPSVMLVPVPGVPGLPGVPGVPDGPVPALPPPELPPEPPPPPAPPPPCANAAPLASAVQASQAIIHVRAFIVVSLRRKHGSRKGRSTRARVLPRTPLQGLPVPAGKSYLKPHGPGFAAAGRGISRRAP